MSAIKDAITKAMGWHPSETGPCYGETRQQVEGLIETEIARLNREALDAHYIMTAQQGEIDMLRRRLEYAYRVVEDGFVSGVFDMSVLRRDASNYLANQGN